MKKFLVLFFATAEEREKMQSATPEQMQAGMKPWMDWFAKVGDAVVDKGSPVTHAMKLTKSDVMPGDASLVAYDIVQAEDIDTAVNLLKDNPHLDRPGGEIDVHEMWDMNGMIKQ